MISLTFHAWCCRRFCGIFFPELICLCTFLPSYPQRSVAQAANQVRDKRSLVPNSNSRFSTPGSRSQPQMQKLYIQMQEKQRTKGSKEGSSTSVSIAALWYSDLWYSDLNRERSADKTIWWPLNVNVNKCKFLVMLMTTLFWTLWIQVQFKVFERD